MHQLVLGKALTGQNAFLFIERGLDQAGVDDFSRRRHWLTPNSPSVRIVAFGISAATSAVVTMLGCSTSTRSPC